MSEHIIDDDTYNIITKFGSVMTTGEVIRCRDCLYWIDKDYCVNPKWRVGSTCERPCTEPDGFCAWAERRKS